MMPRHRFGLRRRVGSSLIGALAVALTIPLVQASPAAADTAPIAPVTVSTVSADALPTVQVNGVVWAQVVVGNTVYATGSFSQARPAGAAAGTSQTARSNILAYNLSTGALITTWAPTLNAQGLAITAAPDGSVIYVGGEFTSVSGLTRNRIVALNPTTGAVSTTFTSGVGARVRALAVTSDTLYAGGDFTSTGGLARNRLAAWATSNGALRTWAPSADQGVSALTVPAGSGEVIAGGRFTTLNGETQIGMGALDVTTGQTKPWVVNQTIQDYGSDAGITSLSSDGNQVYGTGYGYLIHGTDGTNANLENSFAATVNGGNLVWANGCLGDTYSNFVQNGALYTVGHPHNCSAIGGHPQTDPWTYQRAMATTIAAGVSPTGTPLTNQGGSLNGLPAPELLHWLPTLAAGTFTGQGQAAWSVNGNSQYIVLGGEFPSVNGTAQQGLTRFAVRSIAPNKQGPQNFAGITPALTSLAPGAVRVSWQASWDRDNRNLSYDILRGSTVANSTVLATRTLDSAWWNLPPMAFTDRTAPAGTTQTYRIRVTDALGNSLVSNATSFAVPAGTAQPSPYTDTIQGDGATSDWRLDEPSGTTGYDWTGGDDLTVDASATRGVAGALLNETGDTATTFSGSATVPATITHAQNGPQVFSAEAWIKTTTTSGGKIIGFGNSTTGTSSGYDRHVYMANSGRIVFGLYPNTVSAVESPAAYNDGNWHHIVATLGANGQQLYIDGKKVAGRTDTTSAQVFSGYWRIGGDNVGGWPDQPSNQNFTGTIDEAAVYPTALSLAQVRAHYIASGRTLVVPQKPGDTYGGRVWDDQPDLYLRLDETTGTSAVNTITAETGATYSDGVTLGTDPSPAAPAGKSITFPTGGQTVVATAPTSNPQVFSIETWFKTSTTTGGRIMGFGNAGAGSNSSNYDRIINLLDDGTLRYGIYNGTVATIDSAPGYNDGKWHHVVATQGPEGEKLYVDGALVNTSTAVGPQGYDGYWRLGADSTWGGNSGTFTGSLDEAAVYPTVLSAARVNAHYQVGAPQNTKPVAAFSSTHSDLVATFDATASADPDGTISSYAWDFGDGGVDTGSNPVHTYATGGTYHVKLTVTDNGGAIDTATHDVTVAAPNQKPVAAFSSNATNLAATFDGSASLDPDGTIASYAWDFGDSSTGTGATPSHTYGAGGTFPVKLTVTDNSGATDSITQNLTVTPAAVNDPPHAGFTSSCTNRSCAFTSTSTDSDGTVAGYAWDFGDGVTSTATNPTHAYTTAGNYTVTLVVTDNKGATGTATAVVAPIDPPNQLPVAAFTSTATNLSVAFDGTSSSDPDGSIASYAWDFGDSSTTGTGASPNHTYASAGTYSVTLTVTDNKGGTNATNQTVTVSKANNPPTAAFTSTPSNLVVAFNGSTSTDSDGTIATYAWAFGDSTTGTGATPSHTYSAAGTYPITLTVTDDKGATGTASGSVTVTAAVTVLAADAFGRTVANGLGSADTGGVWTVSGTASNFAVGGGVGSIKMGSAGSGPAAYLNSVASSAVDLKLTMASDKVGTGNGVYLWVVGRHTAGGDYRARVRLLSNNTVAIAVSKYIGSTETLIGTETVLSGVTYTAGANLSVRLQVAGTGTTNLRLKVWPTGTTEPSAWQKSETDTTAALQVAGGVGVATYLSGSSTNAPVTAKYDDLQVSPM